MSPINNKWAKDESSKPILRVVNEKILVSPVDGEVPNDTLANSNVSSVTGKKRDDSK